MKKEVVHVVDMSDRLNAEGKYFMKVRGKEFGFDDKSIERNCILDLSELNIDQIGVIAGFLDAVFDGCGISQITGVGIIKPEEVEDFDKWVKGD